MQPVEDPVQRQRTSIADASHELKTPLARGEERRLYALTSGYKVS